MATPSIKKIVFAIAGGRGDGVVRVQDQIGLDSVQPSTMRDARQPSETLPQHQQRAGVSQWAPPKVAVVVSRWFHLREKGPQRTRRIEKQ